MSKRQKSDIKFPVIFENSISSVENIAGLKENLGLLMNSKFALDFSQAD
jgi:hypothetical protein